MRTEPKKRIAIHGATGCRGCEQVFLDLHYQVHSLIRAAEIVYWPYLLGSDRRELEAAGAIDVSFVAGAVQTARDRVIVQQLREQSKLLVACGACAAFGGLPGLANASAGVAQNKGGSGDGGDGCLPPLEHKIQALSQVVAVDYYVPGCLPTENLLWAAFQALVRGPRVPSRLSYAASRLPEAAAQAITSGVMPPNGFVFAGEKAVCASCSRAKEEKKFTAAKRPFEKFEESGRCLLEQGLICLGVSTREGCGGLCTGVGVPCRGCFGKPEAVFDPGAKMVSAISSTFDTDKPAVIARMVDQFHDLPGTFYRYTLPTQCSLLATRAKDE